MTHDQSQPSDTQPLPPPQHGQGDAVELGPEHEVPTPQPRRGRRRVGSTSRDIRDGERTRGRYPGVVQDRDTGMDDDIPKGYNEPVDPDDLRFLKRRFQNGRLVDVFVKESTVNAPEQMPDDAVRNRYGLYLDMPPTPKGLTFWRLVLLLSILAFGCGTSAVAGAYGCSGKQKVRYIPVPTPHPSMDVLKDFIDPNKGTHEYLSEDEIRLAQDAIDLEERIVDLEREVEREMRDRYPDEMREWEDRRGD